MISKPDGAETRGALVWARKKDDAGYPIEQATETPVEKLKHRPLCNEPALTVGQQNDPLSAPKLRLQI